MSLEASMKHIGILAHSFEGATLCYRTACLEGVRRLGAHLHPEITLTGIAMHFMMDAYRAGDHQTVRRMFGEDIEKLSAAGADFFICPDNTAHIALETPGAAFAIPCLHIGEVVAERALQEGRRKVGILGTNWTMTGPVYPGALGRRDIEWAIPDQDDRQVIHVEKLWSVAIKALGPDWTINGSVRHRYHGNLNIRRKGVDGARLIADLRDVAFSLGSACASGSGRPSHVLRALGLDYRDARSSVRLGFGRYTTQQELMEACKRLVEAARTQEKLDA